MKVDPEVRAAFLAAMERAESELSSEPPGVPAVRILAGLRASAAMVGETELAASLFRAERRAGTDAAALLRVRNLLAAGRERYARGDSALRATWPHPPEDLEPGAVAPDVASVFAGEVADRLLRIDRLLAGSDPARDTVTKILREVHGMKGASLAVNAEAMAWYCHGLESALRADLAAQGGDELALRRASGARHVLAQLAQDPAATLARLRATEAPRSAPPSTGRIAIRRSTRPPPALDEGARVSQRGLDGLVGAAEDARRLSATLDAHVVDPRVLARSLDAVSATLSEARRMLGPPRPWGPSSAALSRLELAIAAVGEIARAHEKTGESLRDLSDRLDAAISDTLHAALALRRVPLTSLFERARAAADAQARLAGRNVSLLCTGGDLELDRPMLDQLTDPVLQLVGNCIAHGIESPDERRAAGKAPAGTVTITAERMPGGLRLSVGDDGRGVSVDVIRKKAIDSGLLAAEMAPLTTDEALFDLLFLPGFTTRGHADVLAGRGIGLDLAAGSIRRVGGTVRFSSTAGRGATVTMDLPVDTGPLPILWVRAGGLDLAVSAHDVRTVELPGGGAAPALDGLLAGKKLPPRDRVLVLEGYDRRAQILRVSVDETLGQEQAVVVPVPTVVRMTGPYRGAVAKPDGGLGLLVDVEELAQLA